MKSLTTVIALLTVLLGYGSSCFSDEYEIVFEEGAYQYNSHIGMEHLDNKYLAKVTIKINGVIEVTDLKGSTLPDAPSFYEFWHKNNFLPPNDVDIKSIFKTWGKEIEGLNQNYLSKNLLQFLDQMSDILKHLNYVPVIPSGKYYFVMGCHKNGTSVHGHPYAVRIKGSISKDEPYRPNSLERDLVHGGYLSTLNKNSRQNNECRASGINIHNGRINDTYKDSEGCLTIHPHDWAKFYRALPSPYFWKKDKHNGILTIKRGETSSDFSSICVDEQIAPVLLNEPKQLQIMNRSNPQIFN